MGRDLDETGRLAVLPALRQRLRDAIDEPSRAEGLLEAEAATFLNQVERIGAYGADGHRSAKTWARATCNWSGAEAASILKVGRMFARFPSAAVAAKNGELGVAQMRAFSQVVANPRLSEHLAACEEALVSPAKSLDYDDYVTLLAQWEALADEDGAHGDHERTSRTQRTCVDRW